MTAVEWLIEQLQAPCRSIPSHIVEQAKQMENEEIIKRTLDGAEDTADYVDKVIIKALVEDMHKQPLTFVSKEISDEEIEKAIIDQDIVKQEGYCHCFLEGAKWYREQLKNK